MCGKEEEEREAVEATLHHCVNQAVSFGIPLTADIQSTTLVGGIETRWGHTACTSHMTSVGKNRKGKQLTIPLLVTIPTEVNGKVSNIISNHHVDSHYFLVQRHHCPSSFGQALAKFQSNQTMYK